MIHSNGKTSLDEFVEAFQKLEDSNASVSSPCTTSSSEDSSDSELEQDEREYLDDFRKNRFLQAMENFFDHGDKSYLREAFEILDIDNSGEISA